VDDFEGFVKQLKQPLPKRFRLWRMANSIEMLSADLRALQRNPIQPGAAPRFAGALTTAPGARVSIRLLIISVLVAISGLARLVAFGPIRDPIASIFWAYGPAAAWLLLFIVGLIIYGKRGLWLLVGAPVALLLPALYFSVLYFVLACFFSHQCL
jgi:hypothetical protein